MVIEFSGKRKEINYKKIKVKLDQKEEVEENKMISKSNKQKIKLKYINIIRTGTTEHNNKVYQINVFV